ncbi:MULTISPECIES: SCO family protein [Sphingobacterium]|uniref:SCO family protein n=1 Tax=Sphingobacterium TaxID=28453 RepID=UPI001969BBBB|nr:MULTISPECIES: SCO family protein [unclassified Sphingobacterium]
MMMKQTIFILLSVLLLTACTNSESKEQSSSSIFNLTSEWKNQNDVCLQLKDLKGKTLVVVMIYTSCKTACPILVSKMKQIDEKIDRSMIDDVSLVLVSIDPKTDTPEHLKKFAIANDMYASQWVFLTSDEDNTQEFANVLSMKYKQISPIDFSHSNIISVFDSSGELVKQEEGLEIDVDKVVTVVSKTVKGEL